MKKGLISKIFAVLLVVGLLFSILPTQQAQAQDVITVCPDESCDYTTIQAAFAAAPAGSTIEIGAGDYTPGAIAVNKAVTFLGAEGHVAKMVGTFNVSVSGVIIEGLDISNPALPNAVSVSNTVNGIEINNNIIHHVGANYTPSHTKVINVNNGADNVLIQGNQFKDLVHASKNVDAIYFGSTSADNASTGIKILDNSFENIRSTSGKGVYAINLSNKMGVTALVEGNTFVMDTIKSTGSGFARAIGLEQTTPDTIIRNNHFKVTSGQSVWNRTVGINFEANPAAATVIVEFNNYDLSTYPLISAGSYAVNAKANWWGKPEGMDARLFLYGANSGLVYTPWCTNPECTALAGGPYVLNVTQSILYTEIQPAIDEADEGDLINVGPGSYDEENILITKGITLQGAGAATTSIAPSAVTNNSTFIVRNPSGNVTIDGFNFVMQPKPSYGSAVVVEGQVIAVDSATVTISNNIVTGSDDGSKSDYGFYGQGNNAKVVITGNVINKPGDNPITFEKQFGSTSVTNNTINITANPDYNPYYSMVYEGTVSTPQIVEGNTFNLVHSGSGYAEAITFTTSPRGRWGGAPDEIGHYTDIQIKNNVINTGGPYARGIGIYDRSQGSGYGTVTGAKITGNQIIGEDLLDTETYGVTLRGDVQGSLITGNTINNVNIGVWIRPGEDAGGTCPSGNDISMNQITSVTTNVKNDCVTGKVDASPNWWGKADGPADGSIVGDVAYLPYCTNEGCTEFSKAALYMTPNLIETTDTFTGTKTVEVFAKDVIMLTSYDLELSFDQTFIEVTAVETSEWMPGSEVAGKIIDNENGLIKIGRVRYAFQGDPVTGTGSLIKITFKPKGNLAGSSDTAFTISNTSTMVTWEYPNEGYPIPYDITGGVKVKFGSVVTNVTKQPNVSYTNLATAVTQATAEDTLRADVDFISNVSITIDKALTLNTNEKTISRTTKIEGNNNSFVVVPGGDLIIDGKGTITTSSGTALLISGGVGSPAKAKLVDATLYGPNLSVGVNGNRNPTTHATPYSAIFEMDGGATNETVIAQGNGAELIISGGTLTGATPVMGNGTVDATTNNGGTKITISGDAVIGSETLGWVAVYHPQDGELNISGGTIKGYNGVEMKAGTLNLTGGTINAYGAYAALPGKTGNGTTNTGDAILVYSRDGYGTGTLNVNISGTPTITSANGYALREFTHAGETSRLGVATISGGKFTGGTPGAVFFSTNTDANLDLTGGEYNTNPGLAPNDYVYEPLDTYLDTTDNYYRIMGIVAGTFEPFTADGLVIGPETITDTINYSGAIPWYNADTALGRAQGNRVGMKVVEPEGVDLTGATIKIYRDGIQYYTGGWNASKDAASDNFVPYWALVTNIPQDYKIVVNWNAVSEQTFFAHVLEGSTLVAPPAPIISSTDIQGYYLAGDVREFNVSMKNPDLGANYALMIFDYKLAGVTTADIDSFEYLAPPGDPRAGQWVVMTDSGYETYADCTDGTGVCGQFGWAPGGFGPVPAGFENTSKFRIKFNKGFAAPLAFTLDLSGKLDVADADWTLLTTYNGSLDVHDKPVITIASDPYFIANEPGQFAVTISNPATGRNYGNNIVFDVVIPNHVLADFDSMSCGPWSVNLVQDGANVKARILGLDPDQRFNVGKSFEPMTVTCTATLKTTGEYLPSWSMVDMTLTDERVVQTGTGSMKAYTKPTITATFPTGPIAAGVPVTVPVTITNPDGLPGPFGLVLTLPEGTVISYGGNDYTCTATGCPIIPVDAPLTAGELVITFPGNGTVDVTIELFDTAADPDRKLAETTITGVVIGGDYEVTGYFWLQGTSRRHDIPVTFTWGGTLAPYGPTINTGNTDTVNLTAELTYGGEYLITTNQPRYLNYIAANRWKINVSGPMVLQSRRLLAGNAVWQGPEDYFVIDSNDSGLVANGYLHGVTGEYADADVNFDGRANIQDLALVGGNYMLTSQDAYGVAP